MDKIRIGIIGGGRIFHRNHAPYYHEPTRRGDVVAVADINETVAHETARKFDASAYTDYRQLLDRKDIEAVDIATQPNSHRDIVIAAAEAGKHILVEKPMSLTVIEADEMIEAAKNAGVRLHVAYHLRWAPQFEKMKQLVESGILGTLQLAYSNEVSYLGPLKSPTSPFRTDFLKQEAGGMLLNQSIHLLDLWMWTYGPVKTVYGYASHMPLRNNYPKLDESVENNVGLTVHFKKGGVGLLVKSWVAEVNPSSDEGMVGSNGSATISGDLLRWKTHDMSEPEEQVTMAPENDMYRNLLPEERPRRYWDVASKGASINHWLACIVGDEEPTTDAYSGRAGVELVEAVHKSSSNNTIVSLPLCGVASRRDS